MVGKVFDELLNNEELTENQENDYGMAEAIRYHQEEFEKRKWRSAIMKVLKSMEERKVWEIVEAKDIPEDRKAIGCKWVFKKKQFGLYPALTVYL
jgi:hypothetical protein